VLNRRKAILVALLGVWAFAVLCIGFHLWAVADACQQFGDLQAECIAPQGASILRFLFVPVALTGIALWVMLTPSKNNPEA
jgi:hypothetical protein